MACDEIHIAEICSRLYGFHWVKEDTDVTIHCGGQQFLCHRSVLAARSTYFECMFRNKCAENVTGSVTFAGDHMRAEILLEVLKYIYAGNASITSSNIVDLLYAGEYLGVLGLEAYCIPKLPRVGPEPVADHLWKALLSPQSVFNQSLISVLATCNFTERLKSFFKKKKFLRISADHLVIIVTKLWKSPPIMNDILLRAIYRWRAYALDERKQHALELHKHLEPALENSLKLSVISLESFSRVGPDRGTTVTAKKYPSLYVYARDPGYGANIAPMMRTYRYSCEDPTDKKYVLEYCYQPDILIRDLRFVSVDNVGLFSIATALQEDRSTQSMLFQFASKDTYGFQSGRALTPPPIDTMFGNLDLCNMSDRGLYLLKARHIGRPLCHNPTYDASFSEEEIQRGIYFFNIELDRWLPVPAMINNSIPSCMTVLDNNVVYVIAGRGNKKVVQAYDHRERLWQEMPDNLHHHFQPQSCVLGGSIYVSSSSYCERYDPVAARWEDVAGFQRKSLYIRRLLSYENELWHLWASQGTYSMEVYEPNTGTWSTLQSRLSAMESEHVLDAVIWRDPTAHLESNNSLKVNDEKSYSIPLNPANNFCTHVFL